LSSGSSTFDANVVRCRRPARIEGLAPRSSPAGRLDQTGVQAGVERVGRVRLTAPRLGPRRGGFGPFELAGLQAGAGGGAEPSEELRPLTDENQLTTDPDGAADPQLRHHLTLIETHAARCRRQIAELAPSFEEASR
jgi:hypothetical protein